MRFVLLALFSTFLFAACHDHEHGAYDTLQACFDEHHNVEALPTDQAIVVCCVDHPFAGMPKNTACGADAAACVTYVTANLTPASATSAEIMAACTTYQMQH